AVGGYDPFGSNENVEFVLVRYNAGGSLDTRFGNKGKVVTDFSGYDDEAYGVAVQSGGQIVAAGYAYTPPTTYGLAVARYTTSGGLDSTFGSGGKVTTDYVGATQDYGQAMALQTDGKIVVAGYTTDHNESSEFSLARYNSNGSLDTGFGSRGETTAVFGLDSIDQAAAVAIQPDGKIVVVGTTRPGVGVMDAALVRFTPSGSLDSSFGTGGKVTTDFGKKSGSATAVAVQSDGKIAVAGSSSGSFALARYNADGRPDNSFGNHGNVLTPIGSGSAFAFGLV